jgi:hypothetical protein
MKPARPPRSARLCVESLEERITPTWYVPWPNPTTLTLSFAPDGTNVSGAPSNLFSLLGPNVSSWETTILQAYQTWADVTNINIGLVPDNGQPFGTAASLQGNAGFGNIRIAAVPLSATSTGLDLADTNGYSPSAGSWSGAFLLNSLYPFNVGGTNGAYDLYSVALHESAHSFGLPDVSTNPSSVLYPGYEVWTGLSPSDVTAIQSLYGARSPDPFQGQTGISSLSTAYNLTADGNLTSFSADIGKIGGAEYFQFTTPSASTGVAALTVNLQAAGISLLTSQMSILDANGNVLNSAVTTNPLNNNLSVTLPNYKPSTTYYLEVAGAGNNVFAMGAYDLNFSYSDASGAAIPYGASFGLGSPYVNTQTGGNYSLQTAQLLGYSSQSQSTSFAVVGAMYFPWETDWYEFTPTAQNSFTGTLTVGVTPQGSRGAYDNVAVYNAQGTQLPATVVNNQDGGFTVQLANQTSGTTYYVCVTAANPFHAHSIGSYAVSASLSQTAVTTFESMVSTTLTSSAAMVYSTLSLNQGRVVQFSLSASTVAGAPEEAAGLTIVNSSGHAIFMMAVEAGLPLTTGTVWLGAGSYVIVLNGATADGSPLQNLTVTLSALDMSDPMNPIVIGVNGPPASPPPPSPPPPPSGWFTIGTITTQPPILILDPIGNPILELN